MILTQDFDTDFDLLTAGIRRGYRGEPYAFVRFADGETAIMQGHKHEAKSDGWKVPAGVCVSSPVKTGLIQSLLCFEHGYHVGITAHEHHPDCHIWLRNNRWAPESKITYAEIFIFANYSRFREINTSRCTICAPKGDITVPADAVMTGWDHRYVVDFLIDYVRNPILVAAGPVANIIIHDYWLRCPPEHKQVILDVGSALDQQTRGRRTRQYQNPDHPQATWKPRFWPASKSLTDLPRAR